MKLLPKNIGILGFLGPFRKNQEILNQMNVFTTLVKSCKDLESVDALIIPGTEMNALNFVLKEFYHDLINRIKKGMPLLLTGEATTLLSASEHNLLSSKKMDIQSYSSENPRIETELIHLSFSDTTLFPAYFLRSPTILKLDKQFQVIAVRPNNGEDYVCIENNNIIACTFYPEFSNDVRIHEYLLTKI